MARFDGRVVIVSGMSSCNVSPSSEARGFACSRFALVRGAEPWPTATEAAMS